MDRKELLIGAITGLGFASIASILVRFLGFTSRALTMLLYLYVVLGVLPAIKQLVSGKLEDISTSIVLVKEGEELELKKIIGGESYRVKGEIEKI